MIIGIDASNIRSGGGIIHLREILDHVPFKDCGISQVIVWGETDILECLPEHERIVKVILLNFGGSFLKRFFWQLKKLGKEASTLGCDVLLIPGGVYLGEFRPFASMVQNMQVFEWSELRREGVGKEAARLLLLQVLQSITFIRSNGLIFLSQYCLKYFQRNWKWLVNNVESRVIPHGADHLNINSNCKKIQRSIYSCSNEHPFHILYVSTVKNYKHQWNLIDAIAKLRHQGYPLHLTLVGGGNGAAMEKMQNAIDRNQKDIHFVSYHGDKSHKATLQFFENADIFAFPSSCEAFGISLLEAMSCGLPIACSNYGPMPEVLGEAGVFFDPLDIDSIANVLKRLILDKNLREELSTAARERAKLYSWQICARNTFGLLQEIRHNA